MLWPLAWRKTRLKAARARVRTNILILLHMPDQNGLQRSLAMPRTGFCFLFCSFEIAQTSLERSVVQTGPKLTAILLL